MDIVIPTYGRASNQTTLGQLVAAGLHVHLVVQAREYFEHTRYEHKNTTLIALPDEIRTIAPTRQWIFEHLGDSPHLCMIDDDLVFYKRRDDDRTKLRDVKPDELHYAFQRMQDMLGLYAHAGFASREGANRNTEPLARNTRIMRVLGYNRDEVREAGARFDAMEVMEDFHVALCLLEHGYQNIVLNNYAHNQAGSGAAGGCSHFRTKELHAANARKLAELHPRYVTLVEKTTKGAWGGGTRTDVRIQWKQALKG